MLDPELDVPRTETFAQMFSIRYDYPVHFTRDLFDPRNPCLRQVLMPGPSTRPQRLAVFIDGCFWHSCPLHGTNPRSTTHGRSR